MSNIEETNKLAKLQEEIGDKLSVLLTNIKKDSSSRKTPDYITGKTEYIAEKFQKAKAIHAKLEKLDVQQHTYFSTGYFDQIKRKVEELQKYLLECPKAAPQNANSVEEKQQVSRPEDKNSSPQNTDGENNQQLRLRKQEVKSQTLDRIISQAEDELQEDRPKRRYENLLKKLASQWQQMQELHEEIMVYEVTFEADYFTKDAFWSQEAKVDEILAALEAKISKHVHHEKPSMNLPKIQLPTFRGGYENWIAFHDIFNKVIHENERLSSIEKMQYLKSNVKEEAARIVQHMPITDANYEAAWELLKKRYHNRRLISTKLIDQIHNLPKIHFESSKLLRQMYDTINECLKAIENLGIATANWDPIIGHLITCKWDNETNKLYEQSLENSSEIQNLASTMEFLEKRAQSLEANNTRPVNKFNYQQNHKNETNNSSTASLCPICKEDHAIFRCPKFIKMDPAERTRVVKEKSLCFNCLKHNYKEKCRSLMKCRHCNEGHNTMLHKEKIKNFAKKTSASGTPINVNIGLQNNKVLLATAIIRIKTIAGTWEYLRALIDSGSQASFITEQSAQLLGHPRSKISAEIFGLGQERSSRSRAKIQCQIAPRFPSSFTLALEFLVLPNLTQSLPNDKLDVILPTDWQNCMLADPTFQEPGPIDAILGIQEVSKIIKSGLKKTNSGLIGQETCMGWILSGTTPKEEDSNIRIVSMVCCREEDEQLAKFWAIEEVNEPTQIPMSNENAECEKHYDDTTKRNADGTYTVGIPFKSSRQRLGDSKSKAVARLLQLEKSRLNKPENIILRGMYNEFMDEYISLGHMTMVPEEEIGKGLYYIPHQPVIRESSTTTKLRVVFDASSKTTTGVCLNETMHVGPRLQQELIDILIRWQKHKVVLSADIEKMYRQIRITYDDQKYQRILWRGSPMDPIKEFALTTVTYGTASAPYLAIKTLQQLAKDEKQTYAKASDVALRDFYVDDLITGADSKKEAIKLQTEMIQLMKSGGFNLRKWSSNNQEVLDNLPREYQDNTITEIASGEVKKTLGIFWAPGNDTFQFKVEKSIYPATTKRIVLSEIAKIFDPLGWLSPVVIQAKLLIQEMWTSQLEWDKPVTPDIQKKWDEFYTKLAGVQKIEVPRWIKYREASMNSIELHVFCDASEKAYGAVVYARVNDENISTKLIISKSKVAPIKNKTTLPRLELCAAVLGAKLVVRVATALNITNVSIMAWSDSMITLAWIKGDPSRWKTFVANRVSEINRHVPTDKWQHVDTASNPADLITRGVCPSKIQENKLWWNGPSWLSAEIPTTRGISIPDTSLEEKSRNKIQVNVAIFHGNPSFLERFSSLTRMVRVIAYCNRMLPKNKERRGNLTTEEIKNTLLQIVQIVQQEAFKDEIMALKNNSKINKKSKILSLNPFLDQQGTIRVGGRLNNSDLPFEQKHPWIIPSKSHFTVLIIREAHLKTLHGGLKLVQAYLRQKYWIMYGKRVIKSQIHRCITCKRYNAENNNQKMGNLPSARVTPSPPFQHTGVDYAGPMAIRATKGRGHKSYKGYIAVFVCLSTKAIHLEAVSDMTTESFLAAYRRFTSRRGKCSNMYSDNGTNFVGANNILQEINNILRTSEVQNQLVNNGTTWHFIPPAAPHFGGLWEAGVKSMKHHLKRIIGTTTLTFEELTTLLCQIEACLNSRPLCAISDDPDNISALTPAHFLIGREIISPGHPAVTESPSSMGTRWKLVQKMKKDIWKSWPTEYLSNLQQRYKWKDEKENPKVGEIVLIKEKDINPSRWPLARITDVYPGQDGNIRVVSITKGRGHQQKRAIHYLIPLPVSKNAEQTENVTITSANSMTKPRSRQNVASSTSNLKRILAMCLMTLLFITGSQANYDLKVMSPGLYVEHIGYTKIERGILRMEFKYERLKLQNDIDSAHNVSVEFQMLCNQSKTIAINTKCKTLTNHLNDMVEELILTQEGLENRGQRKRRGLLGDMLTSVFGVNEEVYQDIEKLENNQHEIIKSANHQTKFMISALATFNQTEIRIKRRLEEFRNKLNQGITAINEMKNWWGTADANALDIHVISSYQVAAAFISEVLQYYSKLLDVKLRRGNLHGIATPAHVNKILNEVQRKLPPPLQIVPHPIVKITAESNPEYIQIFGHFLITGIANFTIMKVTPVPLKIINNTYWILEIPAEFIAIDYNLQLYFEMSEAELEQSVVLSKNEWVSSPGAIKNLETYPNCVIDEMYQRSNPTRCLIKQHTMYQMIWKELCSINTWMVISNEATNIAIICNGNRQDVTVNQTCLLKVSQDCIVKSKQNILYPKRVDKIPILASYQKKLDLNLTSVLFHDMTKIQPVEPVIKTSDKLESLQNQETVIQNELSETSFERIRHHSITSSIITSLTIITLLICAIASRKYCIRRRKNRKPQSRRSRNPPPQTEEMIEMNPIYASSSEPGQNV